MLVVPLSFAIGTWVEGHHEWHGVQWGTWRSNTSSFLILWATVVMTAVFPWAPTWALHRRIAGTLCGALSSFNGLSSDTTELLRRNMTRTALGNIAANLASCLIFFFLLRAVPWASAHLRREMSLADISSMNLGHCATEWHHLYSQAAQCAAWA